MKVSVLEGNFANTSGYLCVYILFGALALVTRLSLTILRRRCGRLCLRSAQVSC